MDKRNRNLVSVLLVTMAVLCSCEAASTAISSLAMA